MLKRVSYGLRNVEVYWRKTFWGLYHLEAISTQLDKEVFPTHDGQEFLFVLDGEIKVQVGDHVEVLKSGDAVYYDSNLPHLVKASGGKKAQILAVLYAESR